MSPVVIEETEDGYARRTVAKGQRDDSIAKIIWPVDVTVTCSVPQLSPEIMDGIIKVVS